MTNTASKAFAIMTHRRTESEKTHKINWTPFFIFIFYFLFLFCICQKNTQKPESKTPLAKR